MKRPKNTLKKNSRKWKILVEVLKCGVEPSSYKNYDYMWIGWEVFFSLNKRIEKLERSLNDQT
jgi:hypothetical protein